MFEPTSRYYSLKTTTFTTPEGWRVHYKTRRFLPQVKDLQYLMDVPVQPGDRLDLITARTLGAPDLFWRLCDSNNAMDPFELGQPGRTLRVAIP
ncbi:MAG TPA: hypothetical protein VFA32_10635 [Dehalococcoidia bacterium]|nr:hypothetical protein [Dehalococcoidia bacterium]